MTPQTPLDPSDFAALMDRSFGAEPPHAAIAADLARGRRALHRHRALTGLAGVGVAAAVAMTAFTVPALLPGRPAAAPWAASGPISDAQVVHDCLRIDDHVTDGGGNQVVTRAQLLRRMGDARLMTRADTGATTVATLRAEDRSAWLSCTLSRREPAIKAITLLYPTAVSFPRTTVGGVRAYQPHSESDPRLEGTATGPVPQFEVDCDVPQPEETAAWYREASTCPSYTLTWNDRRPAEVAHATVTTPDGRTLAADVRHGYLSLAWSGPMTPRLRRQVAAGETPRVRRVTFLDGDGKVLVSDRDPGHLPTSTDPGIENFPSLAWWLK